MDCCIHGESNIVGSLFYFIVNYIYYIFFLYFIEIWPHFFEELPHIQPCLVNFSTIGNGGILFIDLSLLLLIYSFTFRFFLRKVLRPVIFEVHRTNWEEMTAEESLKTTLGQANKLCEKIFSSSYFPQFQRSACVEIYECVLDKFQDSEEAQKTILSLLYLKFVSPAIATPQNYVEK